MVAFSAAPFLADTGAVRRILSCARYGGQTVADGNLSRVGKAHPRRERQNLAQGIRQVSDADVSYFQNFDEMVAALPDILKPGDLFLTIGAGNVTTVGPRFLALE